MQNSQYLLLMQTLAGWRRCSIALLFAAALAVPLDSALAQCPAGGGGAAGGGVAASPGGGGAAGVNGAAGAGFGFGISPANAVQMMTFAQQMGQIQRAQAAANQQRFPLMNRQQPMRPAQQAQGRQRTNNATQQRQIAANQAADAEGRMSRKDNLRERLAEKRAAEAAERQARLDARAAE